MNKKFIATVLSFTILLSIVTPSIAHSQGISGKPREVKVKPLESIDAKTFPPIAASIDEPAEDSQSQQEDQAAEKSNTLVYIAAALVVLVFGFVGFVIWRKKKSNSIYQ